MVMRDCANGYSAVSHKIYLRIHLGACFSRTNENSPASTEVRRELAAMRQEAWAFRRRRGHHFDETDQFARALSPVINDRVYPGDSPLAKRSGGVVVR